MFLYRALVVFFFLAVIGLWFAACQAMLSVGK